MLYVKNGKINAENLIFSLPEEMFFDYDPSVFVRDGLKFVTKDGMTTLDIQILKNKPDFELKRITENESYILMSQLFTTHRNGLEGSALFYRNRTWSCEYYEEHIVLENGYKAEFLVTCEISANSREKVRRILTESTNIKKFFLNIQAK